MTEKNAGALIDEALKGIESEIRGLKRGVLRCDEQLINIRQMLQATASSDLRQEAGLDILRSDMDLIKRHLKIRDV